jgi:hypothetical protein
MTHVQSLKKKQMMRRVYVQVIQSGGRKYGLCKALAREFGYSVDYVHKVVARVK